MLDVMDEIEADPAASPSDEELVRRARSREHAAELRERHARARQDRAQREAEVEADPARARIRQEEAAMYADAAAVHHRAADLQREHARKHQHT